MGDWSKRVADVCQEWEIGVRGVSGMGNWSKMWLTCVRNGRLE